MENNTLKKTKQLTESGNLLFKHSKDTSITSGFMGNNLFHIKNVSISLSTVRHNFMRKFTRHGFKLVIRYIGGNSDEGKFKLTQVSMNKDELLELRDSIDEILQFTDKTNKEEN